MTFDQSNKVLCPTGQYQVLHPVPRLVQLGKKLSLSSFKNEWFKKEYKIITSAIQATEDNARNLTFQCNSFCPLRTMRNDRTIIILKTAGKTHTAPALRQHEHTAVRQQQG